MPGPTTVEVIPGWIQAAAAVFVPVVGGLIAWATAHSKKLNALELENAELRGRIKSLENFRGEDLKAIKDVAASQMEILVKLEGVLTELRLTRKCNHESE